MPDVNVDPDKLPGDWRSVVRTGAFVLLLVLGVLTLGAVASAPVAEAKVLPVVRRLDVLEDEVVTHLADTKAKLPVMQSYVDEQRRINCGIAKNIYELCRLNVQARCVPMGASCQ